MVCRKLPLGKQKVFKIKRQVTKLIRPGIVIQVATPSRLVVWKLKLWVA